MRTKTSLNCRPSIFHPNIIFLQQGHLSKREEHEVIFDPLEESSRPVTAPPRRASTSEGRKAAAAAALPMPPQTPCFPVAATDPSPAPIPSTPSCENPTICSWSTAWTLTVRCLLLRTLLVNRGSHLGGPTRALPLRTPSVALLRRTPSMTSTPSSLR